MLQDMTTDEAVKQILDHQKAIDIQAVRDLEVFMKTKAMKGYTNMGSLKRARHARHMAKRVMEFYNAVHPEHREILAEISQFNSDYLMKRACLTSQC